MGRSSTNLFPLPVPRREGRAPAGKYPQPAGLFMIERVLSGVYGPGGPIFAEQSQRSSVPKCAISGAVSR
jgi:hypothetical protein